MDDRPDIDDTKRGLYPKFRAFGMGEPCEIAACTGLHLGEEVTNPFFLMRFDKPYDRIALSMYALACRGEYPQLAVDIFDKLGEPTNGMWNACKFCFQDGHFHLITYWVDPDPGQPNWTHLSPHSTHPESYAGPLYIPPPSLDTGLQDISDWVGRKAEQLRKKADDLGKNLDDPHPER
jgi:hypothetical protein